MARSNTLLGVTRLTCGCAGLLLGLLRVIYIHTAFFTIPATHFCADTLGLMNMTVSVSANQNDVVLVNEIGSSVF